MVDKPHTEKNSGNTQDSSEQMLFPETEADIEQQEEHRDEQEYELTHKRKINLRGRWKRTATYNKMIAVATVVAAAATLFYAVFAALQLSEIKSSSSDTHDLAMAAKQQAETAKAQSDKMSESLAQTKDLIKASNDLARQAKRQADVGSAGVEIARRSMRLEQRAWVGVSDINTVQTMQVGKVFTVNVVFKNTGKTPARNVRVAAVIDPVTGGHRPDFDAIEATSRGLLQPGATMFTTLHSDDSGRGITQFGYDSVMNGSLKIYLHGTVRYRDIFDRQHWATFCFNLLPTGAYGVCAEHNESDNN